jgi:small subunit ribosomal protein S20
MLKRKSGVAWWGDSPSSRKAARRDERRRVINQMRISKIKTSVKKVLLAKDKESAIAAFQIAQKVIMQGATKKVLHLNKASRIVSRLSTKIKNLG